MAHAPALRPAAQAPATSTAGAEAPRPAPIPEFVPELSLPDLAGQMHALREDAGHVRLYNFWATWCEPCRREIPLLNRLQREQRAAGLRVVGIAVDFRDAVAGYVKKTPLDYQVLVGEEAGFEAAQQFGVDLALPFTVFADGANRVVAVKIGELHADEAAAILDTLAALQAAKLSLPEARTAIAARLRELAARRALAPAS
jgi:thiol-disulfide isomerase/thioredoxin